jgi:hypothetical protein
MSLPLQGGNAAAAPSMLFGDADFAQAFLRGKDAFPGECAAMRDQDAGVLVSCRDAGGRVLRALRLGTARATITAETSYDGDRPRFVLRYGDYRPADGTLLPYRITLGYPLRGVSLDIEVSQYEVNPTLAAEVFRPPS